MLPVRAAMADVSQYRCAVGQVYDLKLKGSGDTSFVEKNKDKTFDVSEYPDHIRVIGVSPHFREYVIDYNIVDRGSPGTYSIATSGVSLDTFSIDNHPYSKTGAIHASITYNEPSFVNVWLLECFGGS